MRTLSECRCGIFGTYCPRHCRYTRIVEPDADDRRGRRVAQHEEGQTLHQQCGGGVRVIRKRISGV